MASIAVVILNYNGCSLLQQFLPSVIKHSEGAEIILVDNASTDDSIPWINSNYPDLKLIQHHSNLGFCGGYNEAFNQIENEYAVLINSDVEVTPGWLNPLAKALENEKDIAAVQPKILSYNNKNHFEYAGAAGGFIDKMGYPFCRGRLFDFTEKDEGQYNSPIQVFWTSGACMMIRTSLFKKFGGLDQDFFAHMEEIDLCWKLQRSGYRLMCTPESTVYHLGAGTLSKNNPKKTYLNFRNNLDLVSRHWRGHELAWKLPLRIIMDWAAAILFLVNAMPKHSLAVIKAQIDYIIKIRRVIGTRRTLNQLLPKPKLSTIHSKSIVYQFFILRKKKFRELSRKTQ